MTEVDVVNQICTWEDLLENCRPDLTTCRLLGDDYTYYSIPIPSGVYNGR